MSLAGGMLKVEPLQIRFAHGVFTTRVRLDARTNRLTSVADVGVSGFHLEDVLRYSGASTPLKASLDGNLVVRGTGPSPHDMAATSSGKLQLRIGSGTIDRRFTKLIASAGGGLALLLPQKSSETALRCGVINAKGPAVTACFRRSSSIPVLRRSRAPAALISEQSPRVQVQPLSVAHQTVSGALGFVLRPSSKLLPFLKGKPAPNGDCAKLM